MESELSHGASLASRGAQHLTRSAGLSLHALHWYYLSKVLDVYQLMDVLSSVLKHSSSDGKNACLGALTWNSNCWTLLSAHHECPMHDSDRRRRVQWLTCSYRRLLPSALSGDCGWQSKVQRSTAFVQSGLVRHNPNTCLASVVIRLISSIDSPLPFSFAAVGCL